MKKGNADVPESSVPVTPAEKVEEVNEKKEEGTKPEPSEEKKETSDRQEPEKKKADEEKKPQEDKAKEEISEEISKEPEEKNKEAKEEKDQEKAEEEEKKETLKKHRFRNILRIVTAPAEDDPEEEAEADAEEEELKEEAPQDAEESEEEAEYVEVETQLAKVKKKLSSVIRNNRLIVLIGGILFLGGLLYYLIHSQTYENISVLETKNIRGAVNCNYVAFQDGFLKYSQDGLAYIDAGGTEKWNQAYQIANPFVEQNGKSGVVADKQGNSIIVFQKNGVMGQIETTMPIEKVTLSKQGIVCAILQNDDAAMVICYDTVGNILVEHKTAFAGTGYPMDAALSDDGETLMVDYLYVAEGVITSKVMYYNFGEAGRNLADHMVASFEYPGTISASCFFMKNDISVVVGDDKLIYYAGTEEPKETLVLDLDKDIRNLSHDEDYIGLVLKNDKESGYEARMLDITGKMVMSAGFVGEYNNVKMRDSQMVMYDGKRCSVVLKNGVEKFKGEVDNYILEMVPQSGVNRYTLIDQDGLKKIRLVK